MTSKWINYLIYFEKTLILLNSDAVGIYYYISHNIPSQLKINKVIRDIYSETKAFRKGIRPTPYKSGPNRRKKTILHTVLTTNAAESFVKLRPQGGPVVLQW